MLSSSTASSSKSVSSPAWPGSGGVARRAAYACFVLGTLAVSRSNRLMQLSRSKDRSSAPLGRMLMKKSEGIKSQPSLQTR